MPGTNCTIRAVATQDAAHLPGAVLMLAESAVSALLLLLLLGPMLAIPGSIAALVNLSRAYLTQSSTRDP